MIAIHKSSAYYEPQLKKDFDNMYSILHYCTIVVVFFTYIEC